MTRELSDRAKLRLRIVAGLLRGSGQKLDFPRAEFYDRIQLLLREMDQTESARLKGLTDWVEDYTNNEGEPLDADAKVSRRSGRA